MLSNELIIILIICLQLNQNMWIFMEGSRTNHHFILQLQFIIVPQKLQLFPSCKFLSPFISTNIFNKYFPLIYHEKLF